MQKGADKAYINKKLSMLIYPVMLNDPGIKVRNPAMNRLANDE